MRAVRRAPSVLVVEHDERERARLGAMLEREGLRVTECPGPSAPDYTCLGSRGRTCPLADGVDLVVLDLRQGSDDAMRGTPGWELLFYYLRHDRSVVAMTDGDDPITIESAGRVRTISRPVDRAELIEAVRSLTAAVTKEGAPADGHHLAG